QFREMAAFAQFASDLDAATRAQLERGRRLTELLKQGQFVPLPLERQVVTIFAGTNGYTDKLPVESLKAYEEELYRFLEEKHPDIFNDIREKAELTDDIRGRLDKALKAFGKKFVAGTSADGKGAKRAAAETEAEADAE
ncbi:MAG TPA: F0F1 ATP synthase subunit alpha, partial [Polyangiaceae bacterium]|nr:F0F1 ATP synthase subunit alpha [Polyangiaceae bacterium]